MPIDLMDATSPPLPDAPSSSYCAAAFAPAGTAEEGAVLPQRHQGSFDTDSASLTEANVGDATDSSWDVSARSLAAMPLPRLLWTSFLVVCGNKSELQAFDAVIASDRSVAEARLGARYGSALAGDLEVVKGFDPSLPLVEALLSPAMTDLLKQVAADPASPLADGLSLSVQQRFAL